MIEASCHCGSVKIVLPRKPRRLTSCNCSICQRYSGLWAYYPAAQVRIRGKRALAAYVWGDRMIRHMRCKHCGCVTHWEAVKAPGASRMGVNTRNVDPELLKGVRVRRFDGARTWKFLD